MNCKQCGQKLCKTSYTCVECGFDNTPEALMPPVEPVKRKSGLKIAIAIITCIALLASLAEAVHFGITGRLWPYPNDIYNKTNYTVSDDIAVQQHDTVVATFGEDTLTNGQLQIFYWMAVYTSLNNLENTNVKDPFNEQIYDKTTGKTWQQYYLEGALETWRQYQIFYNEAKKANFEIPKEYVEELDGLDEYLQENAEKSGIDTVEEFLVRKFGAGCTFEDYYRFMEMYYMSSLYFEETVNAMGVTDEEMEAYFKKNQESLEKAGYTKDKGILVDIRHILIQPHNDSIDPTDPSYVPSEEDWKNCEKEAQEIYDKWLNGERTEEYFAFLARMYTKDSNASAGGLYEKVMKGEMVESFDAWCFDESRQKGDTGLVKTKFGYHIMYFSDSELGWLYFCRKGVRAEKSNELWESTLANKSIGVNYGKIAMPYVKLTSS